MLSTVPTTQQVLHKCTLFVLVRRLHQFGSFIQLHLNPIGVFPLGLYEPGGLGFCVGAQCKEFEFFFTLAFKNQQLPNKNSSLSPFIKTGRCSNIESVFLHGSAWLGLSWGFPFMERVPPMCMGATCLASYRHLYVDWNAERRA